MSKTDQLNRQSFIDLLKEIISTQSNNPSGYSIAINGKWGCGKTFVLDMLEKDISNNMLVFHYNAWENDFYKEPLVAILSVIIDTLNKTIDQKPPFESVIDEVLKDVARDLLTLTSVIVKHFTELDLQEYVERKIKLFKKIKGSRKISSEINAMLPLQDAIKIVRANISKLSEKIPVIIIVDELDRCLPEYAIKVLERLHHICNNIQVIQIIAIDKTQIADSVAKVYGKDFTGKNTNAVLQFADSYLQKFVDVTIPLSAGTVDCKLAVLNGLEKKYEPYVINMNGTQKFVSVDDEFLADFISKIMFGVERRLQEKIFTQVAVCHELANTTNAKRDKYDYAILICEIISCIQIYVYHEPQTVKIILSPGQEYEFAFFNQNHSITNSYETENAMINSNFELFFRSVDRLVLAENQYDYQIIDAKGFIAHYYVDFHVNSWNPFQEIFIHKITEDKKFLTKFNEIMATLTL